MKTTKKTQTKKTQKTVVTTIPLDTRYTGEQLERNPSLDVSRTDAALALALTKTTYGDALDCLPFPATKKQLKALDERFPSLGCGHSLKYAHDYGSGCMVCDSGLDFDTVGL